MAKKKQQQTTTQTDATSIPKSIRRILNMCPKAELRPVKLTQWAEELVLESRREGIGDRQIRQWIIDFADSNYWHDAVIDAILRDNGLAGSIGGGGSGGGSYRVASFEIERINSLMESMTGLDEVELSRTEKREDLEKKSKPHILDMQVRLSEFEINHWIAEFTKLATIIDIYLDTLKHRKQELKRSAITE